MQDINAIFSENLKKQMRLHNKTQVEIAEAIGVAQPTISMWLNGERAPRMGKVEALCRFFGCTRSDLIVGESEKRFVELSGEEYQILVALKKAPDATKQAIRLLLGVEVSND